MISADSARSLSQDHRSSDDQAYNVILSQISDGIAAVSIEGSFVYEYIFPVVLSNLPAYDFQSVFARVIAETKKRGFSVESRGPQLIISWHPTIEDDENILVSYTPESYRSSKKIRAPKKRKK